MLSAREIQIILEAIREKYGPGYSDNPEIGSLQAKLSILMEMMGKKEEADAASARRD
jgi:hypothetical protein